MRAVRPVVHQHSPELILKKFISRLPAWERVLSVAVNKVKLPEETDLYASRRLVWVSSRW